MKIEKVKHDHKLTDLLKVGIFALILLAPLMAVGVKCAYVVCNRNAYMNYSGETQTQQTYIHNTNELIEGNTYYFKAGELTESGMSGGYEQYIQFSDIQVIKNNTNLNLGDYDVIGFYAYNTSVYYYMNKTGTTFNTNNYFASTDDVEFSFTYENNTLVADNILTKSNNFYSLSLLNTAYLDNVFTYAVKDLANNDLFNWTQNTAIYTGINAMCTNLEIGTPVIAILITYWTLIVIIYVIIDILLKGFVYLTHLIVRGN